MALWPSRAYIPPMDPTEPSNGRAARRRMGERNGAASSGAAHHSHDHCEGHGQHLDKLRLTPGRQVILDMLCAAGRPLGAYEMIDKLADENGRRPAPISVYRALDYLLENGLVHRLATRNAYLACGHRHHQSEPVVFLICETCGKAEEATSTGLDDSLAAVTASSRFKPRAAMIEIAGVCAACAASG
jgi:Fur family zinc uptake transcriptional regulator